MLLDLIIPCVGGLGEAVDAVNCVKKTAETIDDVHDTYKSVDNAAEIVDNVHDISKTYDLPSEGLCFVAGTLVHTEDGYVPIEEITSGQLVWAWDEATDTTALKSVVETYVNTTSELVHIHIAGEEIVATPSHPFYSPVKGWTDAVRLRAGDILVTVNGEYVIVEKIQHEILENPITVYNFQVADYHTYYVSSAGVLVHNSCYEPIRTPDQQALADLAKEVNRNANRGIFISFDDARYLDELAKEYGVPQHHQAIFESWKHWKMGWNHTHIYNIHVPFK